MNRRLICVDLGRTSYEKVWDLQKKIFTLRLREKISDVLILNEHDHVYTIGKSGSENHLLANRDELRRNKVEIFQIDRGGDITYHGPGQLVGYPILNLNDYYPDIHRYLRDLEDVIMQILSEFGIEAGRDKNYTGVWVKNEKIAAIGVKVSKWITMHGFALNVSTELRYFDRIIPCGIFHRGITSMERITQRKITLEEVAGRVSGIFGKIFGCRPIHQTKEEFFDYLKTLSEEKAECL